MKLIQAVNAYITADMMGKEAWPYNMALALVKVKKQTAADAEFFIEKEKALVREYAALDESGNVKLTPNNTFIFKNPADNAVYEQKRRELCDTETEGLRRPLRVNAPERIMPSQIEALEGFIEFTAEGADGA